MKIGQRVKGSTQLGKGAGRGRALALGQVQETAQENRENGARMVTPEMQ